MKKQRIPATAREVALVEMQRQYGGIGPDPTNWPDAGGFLEEFAAKQEAFARYAATREKPLADALKGVVEIADWMENFGAYGTVTVSVPGWGEYKIGASKFYAVRATLRSYEEQE